MCVNKCGTYFDKCTCGSDKTDVVRCEHMATIALSAVIHPHITPRNVMPTWWEWKQWRKQFLLNVYAEANITIKSMKEGPIPDFSLRFCPDWTAQTSHGIQRRVNATHQDWGRQWQRVSRA